MDRAPNPQHTPIARTDAVALDARDPLARFRDEFVTGSSATVYFDGNSLGRLPRRTRDRTRTVIDHEWGERLIRSWSEGWMTLPLETGDRIGRAALGAAAGQTVVADSTTVCLFKLVQAALDARPGRDEILIEVGNFPTDRYVVESIAARTGHSLRWIDADPIVGPTADDVAALVGPRTAVTVLSHISYTSAAVADMAAINRIAHDAGALTVWDLSHSVGSYPVALDATGTDLAVGCGYKYLNGGPGAPAFLYVNRALQETLRHPISGWFGHRDPFAMGPGYAPAPGMAGWLSGTPPILGLAALAASFELIEEAGIEAIREKAVALTDFALEYVDAHLTDLGFTVASPRRAEARGAHLSLAHPDARRLCSALVERDVIPDFREPDLVRLGLSPLTTGFAEVWDGLETLRDLAR